MRNGPMLAASIPNPRMLAFPIWASPIHVPPPGHSRFDGVVAPALECKNVLLLESIIIARYMSASAKTHVSHIHTI